MSALPSTAFRGARWPLALAGVLILVLAGSAILVPTAVLHGWLIAFASFSGIGLGCIAWLAIHALTGGRWGAVGRPALLAGAGLLPLLVGLVLPLILADRWLYPWAGQPGTTPPDVARIYLNTGSVALRSLVLLGGMSFAAWRARRGPLSPLGAGLLLVFYGGLMNLSAFDWLLSLDPLYTSSAIGMQIITAQLGSGLCFVVLACDAPDGDPVWSDYAGLMLACVLGEAYLILMTFVIHWYGNLPEQADWYLARSHGGWLAVEIVGSLVGAIAPFLALLFGRVRGSRRALRIVAVAVLAGLVLEMIWLVAPGAGHQAAAAGLAGVVALAACGCLVWVVAGSSLSGAGRHV